MSLSELIVTVFLIGPSGGGKTYALTCMTQFQRKLLGRLKASSKSGWTASKRTVKQHEIVVSNESTERTGRMTEVFNSAVDEVNAFPISNRKDATRIVLMNIPGENLLPDGCIDVPAVNRLLDAKAAGGPSVAVAVFNPFVQFEWMFLHGFLDLTAEMNGPFELPLRTAIVSALKLLSDWKERTKEEKEKEKAAGIDEEDPIEKLLEGLDPDVFKGRIVFDEQSRQETRPEKRFQVKGLTQPQTDKLWSFIFDLARIVTAPDLSFEVACQILAARKHRIVALSHDDLADFMPHLPAKAFERCFDEICPEDSDLRGCRVVRLKNRRIKLSNDPNQPIQYLGQLEDGSKRLNAAICKEVRAIERRCREAARAEAAREAARAEVEAARAEVEAARAEAAREAARADTNVTAVRVASEPSPLSILAIEPEAETRPSSRLSGIVRDATRATGILLAAMALAAIGAGILNRMEGQFVLSPSLAAALAVTGLTALSWASSLTKRLVSTPFAATFSGLGAVALTFFSLGAAVPDDAGKSMAPLGLVAMAGLNWCAVVAYIAIKLAAWFGAAEAPASPPATTGPNPTPAPAPEASEPHPATIWAGRAGLTAKEPVPPYQLNGTPTH